MSANAAQAGGREIKGLATLQRFGRSLMLPIAALPVAGLLLRLGQDDLLGKKGLGWNNVAAVVGEGGGAILSQLPLLFAVGVAIGFARRGDGSTAMAAVVGYVVIQGVFKAMSPIMFPLAEGAAKADQKMIDYKVLTGIVVGLVAAVLWQKYHRIKLPPYLAFFGGRRFVPIITAAAMLVIGVVLGLIYPWFDQGLSAVGKWVTGSTIIGAGIYGFVNRLLIPLGLHHIVNTFVWQVFGEYNGFHGDYNRFLHEDPSAGTFMAGYYPIFMFALPAAALAIWQTALPSQKKIVGGLMLSAALTSFLTGVTEPLEFAFMFVAWPLYVVHAVLTGISMAVTNAFDVHHGFSFSAGFIDYVLNWGISTNPVLIIPIGLVFAVIYYFLFRWVITKWNLRTPGREDDESPEADESIVGAGERPAASTRPATNEK